MSEKWIFKKKQLICYSTYISHTGLEPNNNQ